MWEWCWVDNGNSSDEELGVDLEEPLPSSEEEDEVVPSITHSIPFKCIGHLKEK